ncbi:uncharacterized protein LOC117645530 [Thrips palmi]|uniref:Uncharacterized protein LOC117645530 n=1 Tax=Thrips palmi TaxID=161013 RepID=A0A6P8YWQ2_THRPL|nr:uncharacterized protein LOC117645530 [Thrips palmi]
MMIPKDSNFSLVSSCDSIFQEMSSDTGNSELSPFSPRPSSSPRPCSSPALTEGSQVVRSGPSSAPGAVEFPRSGTQVGKDSTGMFGKRGTAKRKAADTLDEALRVVKEMAKEPEPAAAPPDSVDTFLSFVGSRLRAMDSGVRKQCEDQILSMLVSVS